MYDSRRRLLNMSDHLLPDEIISEILSPALKVSDEVFSDTSDISPFANYSASTSAYLLVCKSWLRVATPLLYNVVILRSKAQAKALGLALSKNAQLGHFIKKLRVEGGYGAPMRIILKSSPNISDLFISLEIYSSDNTSGLCKGLHLINPTRLILLDKYRESENKMVSQLVNAVAESMTKWDRLCVFDCPYTGASGRGYKFIQPLLKFKRLHTLAIPKVSGLFWAYSTFKQCPLQIIHIKRPVMEWERSYLLDMDPVLMGLLKFSESRTLNEPKAQDHMLDLPHIAPSLNPSFAPMAGAPKEEQDTVWMRILYFAMSVPELADNPAPRSAPRRLPILLVSKTFNRLGLPYYYSHVRLRYSAISKLASVLSKNPSIGPRIRTLSVDMRLNNKSQAETVYSERNSILTVLSQTSGLVRMGEYRSSIYNPYSLQTEPLSWEAFEALAKSSGSRLRQFSVRIEACQQSSVTIFNDLTALRTLEWKCQAVFIDLTNTSADGFPSLEELRISLTSESFLNALSLMTLKSLQRVMLSSDVLYPEAFLKAHGCKLTELRLPYKTLRTLEAQIFNVCPNLNSISVLMRLTTDDYPRADYFHAPQAVPSLVKIILDLPFWNRRKNQNASWEQFFVDFEPQSFPNLREIEVECCEWPTTERDIAKSCWVRWAEIMLKRNINLTDATGKNWRPRLKIK
ncbi:hypothetical protein B0H13DRAFT_768679 [Mycena leptocephala]|nr:hypothetical protein B0H13DRAFT_768679 [Mycena leptocephala]